MGIFCIVVLLLKFLYAGVTGVGDFGDLGGVTGLYFLNFSCLKYRTRNYPPRWVFENPSPRFEWFDFAPFDFTQGR
jgi:hypothetical protein